MAFISESTECSEKLDRCHVAKVVLKSVVSLMWRLCQYPGPVCVWDFIAYSALHLSSSCGRHLRYSQCYPPAVSSGILKQGQQAVSMTLPQCSFDEAEQGVCHVCHAWIKCVSALQSFWDRLLSNPHIPQTPFALCDATCDKVYAGMRHWQAWVPKTKDKPWRFAAQMPLAQPRPCSLRNNGQPWHYQPKADQEHTGGSTVFSGVWPNENICHK